MIMDKQDLFSENQAVTANAASTNVRDLKTARNNLAGGDPIPVLIQVTEAFNNLTSLKVSVQQATDAAFTTPETLQEETILLADLVVGKKSAIRFMPATSKQYVRLYYTVAGTAPTTGKITAGIVAGHQTNRANV